jgi:hypothetical protein
MIKASLLRQSAQKYATGNVKKSDYLRYRYQLLQAIDNNQPLPKIPKDWMHFQDASMNSELQDFMTKYHELEESDVKPSGIVIWKKVVVGIVIVFVVIVAWAAFLEDEKWEAPNTTTQYEKSNNQFLKNSIRLISKEKWHASDITLITKQWNVLSKMKKTTLKRYVVVRQLATLAKEKQQDENAEDALILAIQKLRKALK